MRRALLLRRHPSAEEQLSVPVCYRHLTVHVWEPCKVEASGDVAQALLRATSRQATRKDIRLVGWEEVPGAPQRRILHLIDGYCVSNPI